MRSKLSRMNKSWIDFCQHKREGIRKRELFFCFISLFMFLLFACLLKKNFWWHATINHKVKLFLLVWQKITDISFPFLWRRITLLIKFTHSKWAMNGVKSIWSFLIEIQLFSLCLRFLGIVFDSLTLRLATVVTYLKDIHILYKNYSRKPNKRHKSAKIVAKQSKISKPPVWMVCNVIFLLELQKVILLIKHIIK